MFHTLQPDTYPQTKTPLSNKLRKLYLEPQINNRPTTVGFTKRTYQSLTPKQPIFKSLETAQFQLNKQFQRQMSPFIKQKIRNSLSRNRKKRFILSRKSQNLDNPQLSWINSTFQKKPNQTTDFLHQTSPLSTRSFKISTILNRQTKSPFKQQQVIPNHILTNTKQRIDRLIQMKKQKDSKFQDLRKSIQRKCMKNKQINSKKISTILNSNKNSPLTILNFSWERQWKDQITKESNRYRNRLVSKHKRDMSMKIQFPSDNQTIQT